MKKDDIWRLSMELGEKFGCHQIPERSFTIFGYQFPLCARCTGILAGQALAIFTPLVKLLPKSKRISLAAIVPTAVDGFTQYMNLQKSNNHRRFATGLIAGFGMVAFCKCILTRKDK